MLSSDAAMVDAPGDVMVLVLVVMMAVGLGLGLGGTEGSCDERFHASSISIEMAMDVVQ
jgi:hypothetical protein